MRSELRRYRSALLLILAFSLGLGAQILQAQVSVTPGRSRFGATIAPSTNDGAALGTTALGWSDLHLATGGVINWANGEVTLTETDANTLTLAGGQLVLPTGSASAPSLTILGDLDTGVRGDGVGSVILVANGVDILSITPTNVNIALGNILDFAGGAGTSLVYEAAAIIQQGADAAVPVAQIFKGSDARAGTDSNAAGGNFTLAPGRPTGTGTPGRLIFSQSMVGATTGTAASPLMTIASFGASGGQYMLPELAADPSSATMTAGAEIAFYTKNNALVIAVNNGGIVWFATLPLTGQTPAAAANWTWSTAAP